MINNYKAKRKCDGGWVYGWYCPTVANDKITLTHYIRDNNGTDWEIDINTLCISTGMLIEGRNTFWYENDKVRFEVFGDLIIKFNYKHGQYLLVNKDNIIYLCASADNLKNGVLIGNIYD